MTAYKFYTDGSASKDRSVGAWACICVQVKDNEPKIVEKKGNHAFNTTSNRMELYAVIVAMKKIARLIRTINTPMEFTIYSDSKYVVDGINQKWYYEWRQRGFKKYNDEDVKNVDLWQVIFESYEEVRAWTKFVWVKGHDNSRNALNEEVDRMSKQYLEIGLHDSYI